MSVLRNIKGNWAKLTFAKTSGIVNRDRGRIQPIADRRVPSSGPRNHCGTLFGFSPFFVSPFLEWRIVNSYRQLHLSATQDKHDVFCRQTFEVWQPLKQTVVSKVKLFTCFWSARSAHLLFFSIFSNISRSETAHLFLWIIRWSFTTPEILLNVLRWTFCWKQIESTNSCLLCTWIFVQRHPKLQQFGGKTCHVFHPFRLCFFVTCTRLDATDGIWWGFW